MTTYIIVFITAGVLTKLYMIMIDKQVARESTIQYQADLKEVPVYKKDCTDISVYEEWLQTLPDYNKEEE